MIVPWRSWAIYRSTTPESHLPLRVLYYHQACLGSWTTPQVTCYHITLGREPTHVVTFFYLVFNRKKRGEGNHSMWKQNTTVIRWNCEEWDTSANSTELLSSGRRHDQEQLDAGTPTQNTARDLLGDGTPQSLMSGTWHQKGITLSKVIGASRSSASEGKQQWCHVPWRRLVLGYLKVDCWRDCPATSERAIFRGRTPCSPTWGCVSHWACIHTQWQRRGFPIGSDLACGNCRTWLATRSRRSQCPWTEGRETRAIKTLFCHEQ